jgi:plastocyanin
MVLRPPRPLAVLLLLLALALAGCSGKGTQAPPTSSSPPAPASASMSMSASMGTSPPASSSSSSSGPTVLSGEVARDVADNSFPDGTFTVKVGTKVTWTDKGSNPHSVSADQGAFDSSPNCSPSTAFVPGNCMKSGDAFSFTFSSAGTFAYHCRVHTTLMKGTVTVVA